MCAPAPFQSPRTGLGSSVAYDAEVLGDAEEQPAGHPELVADQRRAGARRSGTPTGPSSPRRWCPRWPARPACRPACAARRSRARASCRRRRRSSRGPGGPGTRSPASRGDGRPGRRCTPARCRTTAPGRRTSRRSPAQAARVLVGCGVKSVSSTSHMTSLSSGPAERVRADEHRLEHAVGVVARGPGWCSSRRSPRSRAPCRRRRSGSCCAGGATARCRRSRCTRPDSSLALHSVNPALSVPFRPTGHRNFARLLRLGGLNNSASVRFPGRYPIMNTS